MSSENLNPIKLAVYGGWMVVTGFACFRIGRILPFEILFDVLGVLYVVTGVLAIFGGVAARRVLRRPQQETAGRKEGNEPESR